MQGSGTCREGLAMARLMADIPSYGQKAARHVLAVFGSRQGSVIVAHGRKW